MLVAIIVTGVVTTLTATQMSLWTVFQGNYSARHLLREIITFKQSRLDKYSNKIINFKTRDSTVGVQRRWNIHLPGGGWEQEKLHPMEDRA